MLDRLSPDAERALALAVGHVNVSARDPVDPLSLLSAIRSAAQSTALDLHLQVFFQETEIETLSDLVRSGAIDYPTLAAGARRFIPRDHPDSRWLDGRS